MRCRFRSHFTIKGLFNACSLLMQRKLRLNLIQNTCRDTCKKSINNQEFSDHVHFLIASTLMIIICIMRTFFASEYIITFKYKCCFPNYMRIKLIQCIDCNTCSITVICINFIRGWQNFCVRNFRVTCS